MRSICNYSADCGFLQDLPRRWLFGLFHAAWFRAEGLLLGLGPSASAGDRGRAWSNGLKPLATIAIGDVSYSFYVGLGRAGSSNHRRGAVVCLRRSLDLISPEPAAATARPP